MGIFDKGVQKTRRGFFERLSRAVVGKSKVDDDTLDAIEEALVATDMGVDTTLKIIDNLEERVSRDKYVSFDELVELLRDEISKLLEVSAPEQSVVEPFDFSKKPYVVMVVGVNGVGKTTSIGKLADRLRRQGKRVLLCAGDTFRAAAAAQLEIWAGRAQCELIRQHEGADPSAVLFDALQAAKARHVDVVICDTAGRLHNKSHLMAELAKMKRVIDRELPEAALETLLVLDATTGQNGLIQAKQFQETTGLTGIVLTKLDGTAKGGIVIAIAQALQVPVKFVGLGEGIDDLQPFDARSYVEALI